MERRKEGHLPPPPPSLLSLASAPARSKDARRRGQPRLQAPLTPSPRPRAAPERPGGLLPTFPGAPGKQQQLQQQARGTPGGERAATAPDHIPGASSNPALAQPQTPRRAGPGSQTPPYPRREQRRSPPSPVAAAAAAATALSLSCPVGEWEGWLGGGCYSRLKGEEETETGTAAAAA